MSFMIDANLPIWIDLPSSPSIDYPIEQVRGWIGIPDTGERLEIFHDDFSTAAAQNVRPDLSGRAHIGFSFFLDLPTMVGAGVVLEETLLLKLRQGAVTIGELNLPVSRPVAAYCREILKNREQKATFIARSIKGPLNKLPGCHAPSALPENWPISPCLGDKADVASAHDYGAVIWKFLESLGSEAMVLDAGAGLRRMPARNVINLDIYDYPSTDILAIGQDLPFRDNTFDGVLSLAVLEHVNDPFLCARELIRVVKPGGKILAMIPFLQAEHGYPSHYANFTRFGMQELFKSTVEVEEHFLERSNLPIFALNQILSIYTFGLSEPTRSEFLQMKIADLLSRSPDHYIDNHDPIVEHLDSETKWVIAAGTTAIFRKLR